MSMKIKTRFAPSPTGDLHVGGARTALYSWLFSRHFGGEFVLRIEDTDLERSTQQAIDAIMDGMNWLNIDWDEGPYFQTKRFDRYNAVIDEMLKAGTAYKCYCSKERLEQLREEQIARGEKARYDGHCRDSACQHGDSEPHVVRFRNPQEGSVIFDDKIRGPIEIGNKELDDLIIRRTDGSPTYNFCVVIDDWDMEITHVIRGEDHINNTPRQINILKALGAPVPEYAHVSMILGDDGQKLSKRNGAASVMQYRDAGYLPEALLNYLVRLGWSHGDQEIFSVDEMKELFTLDAVSKSASAFNTEKLLWLNHHYINHLPPERVVVHLAWQINQLGYNTQNGPELVDIVKLLGSAARRLKRWQSPAATSMKSLMSSMPMQRKSICARSLKSRWSECAIKSVPLLTGLLRTSIRPLREQPLNWKSAWVKLVCLCVLPSLAVVSHRQLMQQSTRLVNPARWRVLIERWRLLMRGRHSSSHMR